MVSALLSGGQGNGDDLKRKVSQKIRKQKLPLFGQYFIGAGKELRFPCPFVASMAVFRGFHKECKAKFELFKTFLYLT